MPYIFWNMLRTEGKAIGMYPGPLGDRPHRQDMDDAIVSACHSEDVRAMQEALRADFVTADAHWRDWTHA